MNKGGTKGFDFAFARRLFGVFAVIVLLSAYPLFTYATSEVIRACVAGAVLSLANVLVGYAAIEYSYTKPAQVFFKIVFGGFGLRMMFILGAVVMLIKVFHFHVVGLVVSLFSCYIIFLVMEISFIQQKANSKNQG